MTDWRKARAEVEQAVMTAADAYALALAEEMDQRKLGRNGVWCCPWHALKTQVEAEHD